MFTTVASSTTMSWATATMTRISQRWSRAGAVRMTSGDDMRRGSFRNLCCRGGGAAGCGRGRVAGGQRGQGGVQPVEQVEQFLLVGRVQRAEECVEQLLTGSGGGGEGRGPPAGKPDQLGPAVGRVGL